MRFDLQSPELRSSELSYGNYEPMSKKEPYIQSKINLQITRTKYSYNVNLKLLTDFSFPNFLFKVCIKIIIM